MTEDILIRQLREIKYPGKIDITNQVMAEVSKRPLLMPYSKKNTLRLVSVIVAACFAIGLITNVTILFTRSYDTMEIGNALAEVYDYHADYGSADESYYDLGGIEHLYE